MTLTTYNQVPVPAFMYGTAWKKDATAGLVEQAVESGFRCIDTANQLIHYQEAFVGDALQKLKAKGVARESLFLQTKFTSANGQGRETPYDRSADLTAQVNQSMESSLLHLHTDYVDSYVLHGPYSRQELGSSDWEVWAAIEAHFSAGKTKAIGISNVTASQLAELCSKAKNKPMFVQNRCYASERWDHSVREICRKHDIIYQGFSLLTANPRVLSHPSVKTMATRLNTGIPQIIFAFAMQIGMLPLTGTSSAQHMKEDLEAEKLTLTPEELASIETIEVLKR